MQERVNIQSPTPEIVSGHKPGNLIGPSGLAAKSHASPYQLVREILVKK